VPVSGEVFIPEGRCGAWPDYGWLAAMHNASDVAIFLSYCVIAAVTVGWLRRRHDASLQHIFWLFGAFILSCGVTHLLGFLVFLQPLQAVEGWAKLVCAVVSVLTAVLLVPLTPRVMRILPVHDLYVRVQEQEAEIVELRRQVEELGRGR